MKKIVIFLTLVLIMISAWHLMQKDKGLDGYRGDVTSAQGVTSLNHFLYSKDKKFVILSIMIDDAMLKEIQESMKQTPNIVFHVKDPTNSTKKIAYIIRTREDSRKEFILDMKGRKIEGVFKVHHQITPKGEARINLIAISPSEFKKKPIK